MARAQSDEVRQWSQQQKLTANDGDSNDSFGQSVSVSDDGTTALVTAFEDEDPNGNKAGSAYVFTKSGGNWSQQQKLSASDGDIDDGFGVSVSLSADGATVLIGAADIDERDDVEAPGSVYVFTESGESWSQQQKLTADDGDTGGVFGRSVSVSDNGTTALIGHSVFMKSEESWSQQQKLTTSDSGGGILGVSISLSDDGTAALIGDSGSAYVFTESDGSWSQQQKLTVADGDPRAFGESVSISDDGTTALIGALGDEDRTGSAYVFTESGGSWSQQQKLTADDGDTGDDFGNSVSLSNNGTTAFIGADSDEDPNGDRAGSAYVFTESGGSWSQQQKLSATNGGSTAFFGRSVSVLDDGTTVLIGAPFAETSTSSLAGSAYVFTSDDGDNSEPEAGPFGVSKLEPADVTVSPDAEVTLTATISNDGEAAGDVSVTATLDSDDITDSTRTLTSLSATATRQVEFSITAPQEPGEYTHGIRTTDDVATGTLVIGTDDGAVYDPESMAGEYDSDGDGQITASELGDAVTDFGQGELNASELGDVVTAFGQS